MRVHNIYNIICTEIVTDTLCVSDYDDSILFPDGRRIYYGKLPMCYKFSRALMFHAILFTALEMDILYCII